MLFAFFLCIRFVGGIPLLQLNGIFVASENWWKAEVYNRKNGPIQQNIMRVLMGKFTKQGFSVGILEILIQLANISKRWNGSVLNNNSSRKYPRQCNSDKFVDNWHTVCWKFIGNRITTRQAYRENGFSTIETNIARDIMFISFIFRFSLCACSIDWTLVDELSICVSFTLNIYYLLIHWALSLHWFTHRECEIDEATT